MTMDAKVLLQEAKLQTDAIHRLGNWLRAGLSLTVLGFLLVIWGIGMNKSIAWGVFGIAVTVAAGLASFLIKRGRDHGRKNVEHILEAVR